MGAAKLKNVQRVSIWGEGTAGQLHIEVDSVAIEPPSVSAVKRDDKPNIVELAQSVDDLSTLVAAVVAGDLAETLSSPGPFTVFAPTNEAFVLFRRELWTRCSSLRTRISLLTF